MAIRVRDLLKVEIGRRVKAARDALGYSQELCAGLAGISLGALEKIERGVNVPRGDTLLALGYVLGVKVEDLMPDDYGPFVERPLIAVPMASEPRADAPPPEPAQRARKAKKSQRVGKAGSQPPILLPAEMSLAVA